MLRAVIALGGTAAGLAALLSFKTHPAVLAMSAPSAPSSAGSASTPGMGGSASSGKQPAAKGAASKKGSAGGSTAQKSRMIAGGVANTQYGPMQVEVTLTGKKIDSVKVLQQTNDGSESQQIDSMSIPKLTSETLTAQSAKIDAVSGATYTSEGYQQSLQSALDKA
jgi:uncharacterized protein with FMN-binding domain